MIKHLAWFIFVFECFLIGSSVASEVDHYKIDDRVCLSEISVMLYGKASKWKDIARWNHLKNPHKVLMGQTLRLEEPSTLTVEQGQKALLQMWRKRFGLDEVEDASQRQLASNPVKEEVLAPPPKAEPEVPPWEMSYSAEGKPGVFESETEVPVKARRSYFFTALGLSHVHYREGSLVNYQAWFITPKIALFNPLFPPAWDLNVSVAAHAVPISSNKPSVNVQFINANVRLSYAFPFVSEPWRFTLATGLSYSQMLVSNNAFGYQPLFYPQFFPTVRRVFSGGNSMFAYLKYVPTQKDFGISLTEREIGVGLQYIVALKNAHPLALTAEYSSFVFYPNPAIRVSTISYTLGLSYGL